MRPKKRTMLRTAKPPKTKKAPAFTARPPTKATAPSRAPRGPVARPDEDDHDDDDA